MADATEDDASKSWLKDLLQNLNKGTSNKFSSLISISSSRQCDFHPPCGAHPPRAPRRHARPLYQDLLLRLEAQIPVELGHEMRAAPAVDDFSARLAHSRHHVKTHTARDIAEQQHSGGAATAEHQQFTRRYLTKYTSINTGQSDSFHAEPAKNASAK